MTAQKHQNIRPGGAGGNELAPREKIIGFDPFDDGEVGGEGGAEDEDEALDPEASGRGPEIAKIEVLSDGALQPLRAELFALARADGFDRGEAWAVSGGGARSYKQRIERNPLFQERVAMLASERTKIESVGVEGEAMWAAKQNWRLARAGGVVAEIHRATVLLVETTRAFTGAGPADPSGSAPAAEGEAPRPGPGRPPHQPRQVRVDVEQMKGSLLHKGIKVGAEASA